MEVSQRELLCLALDAVPGSLDRPPVPWRHSLTGLTDALTSDGVPKELDVLLELEEMEADGLVEQATRPVDGIDEDRRVFELTDTGRERALKLRQALVDEPVTVRHDGELVEISLGDVGEYLDSDVPIVRALVDAGPDGVLDADRYRPGERFVGRDRIIALFEKDVWQTDDGPRGLLLQGPSGVGKAAITEECARSIRSEGDTVLVGETPEAGGASYAPFRSIFQQLGDGPTPFETITPSNEEMDSEDYQSMRLSLFYDLYEHLREYALEVGPTLVVLRDLQWASSGTLDLLSFLLTRLDEAPVSVLGTVNTEHQDEQTDLLDRLGDEQRPVTEELFMPIEVQPLDRWEFEPLVQWHLHAEDVPEDFLDVLHEHTGGNPEYVASVLDHLRETEQLDLATDTYPTTTDELSVPESTQSIIEARIERLDDVHREVLEAAAVVGERASLAVLTGMVGPSESALRPIAEDLVQNALWERSDQVTAILSRTYKFRTPLARRAILQELEPEQRARLHATAAEAVLETTLSADRLKEAVAAQHYDQADQPARALESYRDAGLRATKLYNHDEAVDYYERAMELATSLDREERYLDLLEALSRVQYCKGDTSEASLSLKRLLDRTDDPERIQSVTLTRWRMAKEQGDLDQAEEYVRSGIEMLGERTSRTCRLWGKLGVTELRRGNVEKAAPMFEKQEEIADGVDKPATNGALNYNRALLARTRGDLQEAIERSQDAVLYYKRAGVPREVASSQMLLGVAHNEKNNNTKAIQAYEASRDQIDEVGNRIFELHLDVNRANCVFARGEWSTALQQYEEVSALTRKLDQQLVLVRTLINRGMIYCYRGELASARDCAEEALSIAASVGEPATVAAAKVELTKIALFQNNLEEARKQAKTARDKAEGTLPKFAAKAECYLGDIERLAGNHERALEYYEQSYDRATSCDSTPWCCYATAGLAAVQLEQEKVDTALKQAKKAHEEVTSLHYVEVLVYVHVILARCLNAVGQIAGASSELDTALATAQDVDATVLESRVRLQSGRLKRKRAPEQAVAQVETALELATETNATLLEDQCRTELRALKNEEQINSSGL
jgi:tetratricopeptide (TPR) repeat protein